MVAKTDLYWFLAVFSPGFYFNDSTNLHQVFVMVLEETLAHYNLL